MNMAVFFIFKSISSPFNDSLSLGHSPSANKIAAHLTTRKLPLTDNT